MIQNTSFFKLPQHDSTPKRISAQVSTWLCAVLILHGFTYESYHPLKEMLQLSQAVTSLNSTVLEVVLNPEALVTDCWQDLYIYDEALWITGTWEMVAWPSTKGDVQGQEADKA